jgi:hypothetical protein
LVSRVEQAVNGKRVEKEDEHDHEGSDKDA